MESATTIGTAGGAVPEQAVAGPPTLLKALLAERHWKYERFRDEFSRAAAEVGLTGAFTVERRQYDRWLNRRVKNLPRPDACQVLERMFDLPVAQLLAPPPPDGAGDRTGDGTGRPPGTPPAGNATHPGAPPCGAGEGPGLVLELAAPCGHRLRLEVAGWGCPTPGPGAGGGEGRVDPPAVPNPAGPADGDGPRPT